KPWLPARREAGSHCAWRIHMRVSLPDRRARRALVPYAFILPAVVALLMFSIYPFLTGIWYSFTSIGYVGDVTNFVGLKNYVQIFTGDVGAAKLFKDAFAHSIIWTATVV